MIRSVDMSSAHVRLPFELLDARVVQNQNSKLNISLNLADFFEKLCKVDFDEEISIMFFLNSFDTRSFTFETFKVVLPRQKFTNNELYSDDSVCRSVCTRMRSFELFDVIS